MLSCHFAAAVASASSLAEVGTFSCLGPEIVRARAANEGVRPRLMWPAHLRIEPAELLVKRMSGVSEGFQKSRGAECVDTIALWCSIEVHEL